MPQHLVHPGRITGLEMVSFFIRILIAGAPDLAPASLGPEMVSFLLRISAAGAQELAPAGSGPRNGQFLF